MASEDDGSFLTKTSIGSDTSFAEVCIDKSSTVAPSAEL